MIELASPAEIRELKALWKRGKARQCIPSYDNTDPGRMERERLASKTEVPRGADGRFAPGVVPPKWKGFEKVDVEYRASEEKRKILRPPRISTKEQEREENERWDRIFKEKFEDKSYYAR